MLATRLRLPALLAGALFATACGDDEITRSELPREFAKLTCDQLADCPRSGTQAALIRALIHASPKGTCEDVLERETDVEDTYDAQLDAGTIRYDSAAAKRCLDAISGSCTGLETSTSVPACNAVYRGTVATGGACTISEECADDGYCRATAPGTCGGTCQPTATVGQPCGGDDPDCASGAPDGILECEDTDANPEEHCVLHRTIEVANGQPCGDTDTDGDDQTTASCRRGSYCKYADSDADTGVCAATLADLATCDPEFDACTDGACVQGSGGARCQVLAIENDENAGCDEGVGPYCNPLLRLACASGLCQKVGDGTIGAGCRSDWATDCDEGLYCDTDGDSDTGVCAAKLANGATCDPDDFGDSCVSGFCQFGIAGNTCAESTACE